MSNGNLPWGDAFIAGTPALENYGLQLYNEERQRQQIARQEATDLDRLMNTELGKIRSADTPEFIGQYQKYKDIKRQLYNPKVQRNAKEVARINQEAAVELSKAMQLANQSIEFKERMKSLNAERVKKPDYFVDDFQSKYESTMNTPLSGIKNQDLNEFYYQGNVTNMQPIFDKAKGPLRPIGDPVVNDNFGELEREITSYKGYNAPRQYFNSLVGGLKGSRAQKDLVNSFDYSPEEQQRIEERYQEEIKNNPALAKAYGLEGLQFPEWADFSEVGRMAKIMAMEHGLSVLQSETKRERKADAVMERQQKYRKEIQGMISARSFSLANLRRSYQVADQEAQDDYVDAIVEGYQSTGNVDPKVVADYEKADDKGHAVPIQEVSISKDGKTYDFIVRDKDGKVDPYWSTTGVPVSQIKARTRKYLETPITGGAGTTPNIRLPKDPKKTKMQTKKKINW